MVRTGFREYNSDFNRPQNGHQETGVWGVGFLGLNLRSRAACIHKSRRRGFRVRAFRFEPAFREDSFVSYLLFGGRGGGGASPRRFTAKKAREFLVAVVGFKARGSGFLYRLMV